MVSSAVGPGAAAAAGAGPTTDIALKRTIKRAVVPVSVTHRRIVTSAPGSSFVKPFTTSILAQTEFA
jgi:hypothetical protein